MALTESFANSLNIIVEKMEFKMDENLLEHIRLGE